MADQLTTVLTLNLAATFKNVLTGSTGTAEVPISVKRNETLNDGTSASQADKVWASFSRSLAQNANEDIDVYDLASLDIGPGAGRDPLGQDATYVEGVLLYVANASTSAGQILVGGEGTGAAWQSFLAVSGTASDTAQIGPIKPGGFVLLYAPTDPAYAIANTTNHLLTITENNTGTVSYDIVLIARSA